MDQPTPNQYRPRVLLCWGYHRAGWVQPFEDLRSRFDFTYLFFRTPEEEEGSFTEAPRRFWSQYRNAQAILDDVQPDSIVFMALDGAWSIALNAIARDRGVRTLIVQHGHLEAFIGEQQLTTAAALSKGSPLPALRFAVSSLRLRRPRSLYRLIRFLSEARRRGPRTAMVRHRFAERMPDHYVALSPESARVHVDLDGAENTDISCIGLAEYDAIFRDVISEVPANGPVLLIDSPNADNRWGATTTTIAEKKVFLTELGLAAAESGRALRVKLHPENYAAGWLPDIAGCTYLRDVNVAEELSSAGVCIGFDSTLMIPAVFLRPAILLRLRSYRIVDLASDLHAALVLESIRDFGADALKQAELTFVQTSEARHEFVRRLAYSADGRAVERLAETLMQQSSQS
jgi:hypothetical protein